MLGPRQRKLCNQERERETFSAFLKQSASGQEENGGILVIFFKKNWEARRVKGERVYWLGARHSGQSAKSFLNCGVFTLNQADLGHFET